LISLTLQGRHNELLGDVGTETEDTRFQQQAGEVADIRLSGEDQRYDIRVHADETNGLFDVVDTAVDISGKNHEGLVETSAGNDAFYLSGNQHQLILDGQAGLDRYVLDSDLENTTLTIPDETGELVLPGESSDWEFENSHGTGSLTQKARNIVVKFNTTSVEDVESRPFLKTIFVSSI
jgi:uncharacterized protein YkuJ